ncbi:MAG: lipoprotein-releasing ABC transporter permease subunit [Gammaproteobacteria bacterium]|nr:lipoprotein-releasing ABC transporter permease subunit [Gammaproteobacteria bacterium]
MRAMSHPVEFFVGLRYLRAKRKTRFVSFITFISLAGVALGVAALIVILSVMNGFEGELRQRLLSMTAHGVVSGADGRVADWRELRQRVAGHPGVAAAAPFVQVEGMIRTDRELRAVMIHGIDPQLESQIAGDTVHFLEGRLEALAPGSKAIFLGRILALSLGARIGDGVTLLIPRASEDGTLEPLLERFVVRGVFEAGVQDHDAILALTNLEDASRLLSADGAVSGVRFVAQDVMAAPRISGEIRALAPADLQVSDWTIENASYFRAIKLEKMMMSLILSLIIGVAAFNIVASLVMVVTDKTNDIAILRTLGMSPRNVVRIFFIQGAAIGWLGVFVGVLLGVLLAVNVPAIAPVLERLLGFQIMPGDVYYVTRIPSVLEARDVAIIALAAFLLTSVATLYPARRAALVNPAAALRY